MRERKLTGKDSVRQLCADIGCNLEDLRRMMVDRDEWRERESELSVLSARLDADDNISKIRHLVRMKFISNTLFV